VPLAHRANLTAIVLRNTDQFTYPDTSASAPQRFRQAHRSAVETASTNSHGTGLLSADLCVPIWRRAIIGLIIDAFFLSFLPSF